MKKDKLDISITMEEIRQLMKHKLKFYINEKMHYENFLFFDYKKYEFVVAPEHRFKEKNKLIIYKNTFSIFVKMMQILSVYHKNYFIFKVNEFENILDIEFLYINQINYFLNICTKSNFSNMHSTDIVTFKNCNNLIDKISSKILNNINSPETFSDKISYINSYSFLLNSISFTIQEDILLIKKYYESFFSDNDNLFCLNLNDLLNVNFIGFLYLTEFKSNNFIFIYSWCFLYHLIKNEKHIDLQIKKITNIFIKKNEIIFRLLKRYNRFSFPKYYADQECTNSTNLNFMASNIYKFLLNENFKKLNQENNSKDIHLFMLFYLNDHKKIDFLQYQQLSLKVKTMIDIIYEYCKNNIKLRLSNLSTFKILLDQENYDKFLVESYLYKSTDTTKFENYNIHANNIFLDNKIKNCSVYVCSLKKSKNWLIHKLQKKFSLGGKFLKTKISEQTNPVIMYSNEDRCFANIDFHLKYSKEFLTIENNSLAHDNKIIFFLNNQSEKKYYEIENLYHWFKKIKDS